MNEHEFFLVDMIVLFKRKLKKAVYKYPYKYALKYYEEEYDKLGISK